MIQACDSFDSSPARLEVSEAIGAEVRWVPSVADMAGPHHHPELELNLVVSGEARYLLNGRRYDLAPGSLVWLFPAQGHLLLGASPRFQYVLGVFRPVFVAEYAPPEARGILDQEDPPGDFCRILAPEQTRRLEGILRETERCRNPHRYRLASALGLASAWEAFQEAAAEPPRASLHPAIHRAIELLQESPDEWPLKRLSMEVGLTSTYLSTLFHQQVGQTLIDFRTRLKLDRATQLWRESEITWMQAALDAGFGSYSQFYRTYLRRFGTPPSHRHAG